MRKVIAALLIQDNKCLIARRKAGDKLAGWWEFPGGKLESGETPEECLVRELQEELGIDVRVQDFFMDSVFTYEFGAIHLLVYRVKWLRGEITPYVHDKLAWVDSEDINDYEFLPADAPSVRALSKIL